MACELRPLVGHERLGRGVRLPELLLQQEVLEPAGQRQRGVGALPVGIPRQDPQGGALDEHVPTPADHAELGVGERAVRGEVPAHVAVV